MPAITPVHSEEKKPFPVNVPEGLRVIVWICIGVVIIISLLDIVGWIFGLDWLKGMGYDREPMRIISSVCFLISSGALIVNFSKKSLKIKKSGLIAAGVILTMVGALSILSWTESNLKLEEIFDTEP